ncbi:Protein kinase, putative [Hondaea fermentalgiana]|uniref:Protein kinase, putative n=1 Tax=Hondaea fermentalgiana TaxID=2315210 RepID=A0A2R5GX51_9STRA|nr:Protein kinase, putative [Hondaea fermentalgiana]|eukprot:GBG35155.1 Protein kinase, putative [Hondaea fermentalgiana]
MEHDTNCLGLLESGSASHVYHARNWEGGDLVGFMDGEFAVKVYRCDCENAQDEAARELRALERLTKFSDECRFIVKLYFIDELAQDSLPIFGLEFCKGGDLFWLLQHGPLTEYDTAQYASEMSSALECMRQTKILHGDLKPENIGLTATGHIRIFDFGTAKILENDEPVEHFAGTLLYASPEALCRLGCEYAADWWAMGVLLFEMLTGQFNSVKFE